MTTRSRSTVVCIQDAGGNTITTASDSITLTIATGPASSAITGGGATATASGVATFASVKLDKAGSYTLKATGGTYGNVTSGAITLSARAARQIAFTPAPRTGEPRVGEES